MRIMLKMWEGDHGFRQTSFFIKQVDMDNDPARLVPRTTLICLDAPPYFRQRICRAFDPKLSSPKSINGIIADPFRIFLVPIMGWLHWKLELFWALRNRILALESANGMTGTKGTFPSDSQTPQFAYMHSLAKDTNQAVELLEIAVRTIKNMKRLHASLGTQVEDENVLSAMEQTSSALELSLVRLEGTSSRV
jgi:hypothetical protein